MPEQQSSPIDKLDEAAMKILWAASRRFLHYGYGKTTKSEIARDCNMSTGNLYRYFPSKLDIAQEFVSVLRREQLIKLRAIAANTNMSAGERVRAFLKTKFKIAYERFHDRPKAYELSAEILSERPKFAVEWEKAEAGIIKKILQAGEASGEFSIANKDLTARVMQDAAYRFTSPAVFHEGDFDGLAIELDEVIDLILDGFAWRARKAAKAKKRK